MGVGVFLQGGVGADGIVHPQVSLAFIGIGAVAGEAFIGEDGSDIEVIADGVGELVGGEESGGGGIPEGGDQENKACQGEGDGKDFPGQGHVVELSVSKNVK